MEHCSPSFLVFLILLSLSSLLLLHRRRRNHQFPPGPPGWPILGNLLDLGSMPHRSLTDMRQKYGDIIGLRLGAVNTVVILSAKAATELFRNHDLSFAERTVTETMQSHGYNQGSVALAPYGSYWRTMRRLVKVDMLVNKRMKDTAFIRRKCVGDMLRWIEEESKIIEKNGIRLARFVFLMTINLLGNLMLSHDLVNPESKEGSQFFTSVVGLMEASGYANVADYFPWLKCVDPQGLKRRMDKEMGKAMEIASQFVKERIEENKNNNQNTKKDFLDVLLEFEGKGQDEPVKNSDRDVNLFILEIFIAGSETTSSTIEWAMTELLCNPEIMAKAKAELASVIGTKRKLEESDIDNLPFLQAIIKETLRLHPPLPFLLPRKAIKYTKFMGYQVPKATQVLVNAWAIGRVKDVWDNPFCFHPERFIGSKVDYKGHNYELIPFGTGRRICAGISLAHRVLHLILGSLLQQFDWKFDASVSPSNGDMRERMGITMRKLEPLLVVPKKCNI